jgi:RNA polymerase sigma factor (sigma-70 family)
MRRRPCYRLSASSRRKHRLSCRRGLSSRSHGRRPDFPTPTPIDTNGPNVDVPQALKRRQAMPVNRDVRARRLPTSEWLESPCLARVAARVAYQYGIGTGDLPDLLQEIRIAIWEAVPVCVSAAWVYRVASHKAVDILRQRTRTRGRYRAAVETAAGPGHHQELDHLLHAKVDTLPPRLRQFYDLHYRQGLSEREIARRLGMCRASVRWLDHCCRQSVAADSPLYR